MDAFVISLVAVLCGSISFVNVAANLQSLTNHFNIGFNTSDARVLLGVGTGFHNDGSNGTDIASQLVGILKLMEKGVKALTSTAAVAAKKVKAATPVEVVAAKSTVKALPKRIPGLTLFLNLLKQLTPPCDNCTTDVVPQ